MDYTNKTKELLFEVKDQYLATLFFCLGIKLEDTRRENSVVFFIFQNKQQECKSIIRDYYQGKLRVDPKQFVDAYITVKNLIFSN